MANATCFPFSFPAFTRKKSLKQFEAISLENGKVISGTSQESFYAERKGRKWLKTTLFSPLPPSIVLLTTRSVRVPIEHVWSVYLVVIEGYLLVVSERAGCQWGVTAPRNDRPFTRQVFYTSRKTDGQSGASNTQRYPCPSVQIFLLSWCKAMAPKHLHTNVHRRRTDG